MNQNSNTQQATCPSCGQPVVAEAGVTAGTYPYCGNAIPAKPEAGAQPDAGANARIL